MWNPQLTKGPTWSLSCPSKSRNQKMIQLMKSKKSLLLDGRTGYYWLEALQNVMSALERDLEIASEAETEHILWRDYDLIILDAGIISDLPSKISQIRWQSPEARIMVFSSAPDWKQAREVMLAGAMDYARKSLDERYMLTTLRKVLARQAPSWHP